MTMLVVMTQHPAVRRGCKMVAHTQANVQRLPDMCMAFFLLVIPLFQEGKRKQVSRQATLPWREYRL
jgi:hypothetical protein